MLSASLDSAMSNSLAFTDHSDLEDLRAFLSRAHKLDSDGAVKLRVFGDVLAVYVSPIFSGSLLGDGPTVLGLRTMKLATQAELDGTFDIAAVLERIPRSELSLTIPPAQVRAAWSGVLPPRQGWELVGTLTQEKITEWAKAGIEEVATSLPESVGSSIAAKVRLQIWGRAVDPELNLPGAAAFAMAGLGFMQKGEVVNVYVSHNWLRLTSLHGHVLSKKASAI